MRPVNRAAAVLTLVCLAGGLCMLVVRGTRPYFVPVTAKPLPHHSTSAHVSAELDRVVECVDAPALLAMLTQRTPSSVDAEFRSEIGERSSVYFVDGAPAEYDVSGTIHAEREPAGGTRVTVTENTYRVVTGTVPTIGHAWEENVTRAMPPTTEKADAILRSIVACSEAASGPAPR